MECVVNEQKAEIWVVARADLHSALGVVVAMRGVHELLTAEAGIPMGDEISLRTRNSAHQRRNGALGFSVLQQSMK